MCFMCWAETDNSWIIKTDLETGEFCANGNYSRDTEGREGTKRCAGQDGTDGSDTTCRDRRLDLVQAALRSIVM